MASFRLPYVTQDRDRHGNLRFYFRRSGKPKVRLRGMFGSDEFMSAYQAALKENTGIAAKTEKSLDWLCDRYYKSASYQSLEEYTKRRKRAVLDEVCNITFGAGNRHRVGSLPFESMSSAHVRKLRDMKADKPEAANYRLKQLSVLFTWGVKQGLAKLNPVSGVEKLSSSGNGYYTWTEGDVEMYESHYPIGSQERLALALMLYLGVRRSDAVRLRPQHENKEKCTITFTVFKGRKKSPKTLTLPILPPLRAIIDASEVGETAYLVTKSGKPHGSGDSFGNWFRDCCRAAGLPDCSPHGLRKAASVRCAEAGASVHELMAMFGWDTPSMAMVYTRMAEQRRLASSAAEKLVK
jgi:integrase